MNEFYLSTEFAVENTKEPINKQIYRFLKKAIIECRLLPGDPLSENEVSSKFKSKVSRQPVREALIKLAEDDFVEIQPKKTTRVARISRQDIMQGADIRMAIEGYAIAKAIANMNAKTISDLEHNLERQKAAAEQYDLHEHFRLDEEFHRTLLYTAGLDRAWTIVEQIKGTTDRVRFLSLEYELTPIISTSEAHERILNAIKKKDTRAAKQAVLDHVLATRDQMEAVIAKCKKEWFRD
ncbi:MAG: GntR family transcriptional regulator [Succinivibrio sp.]|jgi:DNA-binding GntR family transcriptional regulator|nr:GntR family transcriptional regulator [Succinivibrio sp.]